jgi:hypothetical protein
MKTKFTTKEIFDTFKSKSQVYQVYEQYFSQKGWMIDLDNEEMFIIIDKEINLNEGDRIDLYGYRKVTWKCLNILEDIIEYNTEEE